MKTYNNLIILLFFFFFFMIGKSHAQVPVKIPFSGILHDSGEPVRGLVSLRISIYGGLSTPLLYRERFNTNSNDLGLFNLTLGTGISDSGLFNTIDWTLGDKFVKVELDTGVNNYLDMGTEQLLSVPYALFAGKSASSSDNRWSISGSYIYNNNSGNVGIGTINPSRKLSVEGAASIGNNLNDSAARPNGLVVLGYVNPLITERDSGEAMQIPLPFMLRMVADSGSIYSGGMRQDIHNPSWAGSQMNITGSDYIKGSVINLKGTGTNTNITGTSITGSGSGKSFTGTTIIAARYQPVGSAVWPAFDNAVALNISISASDTVIGAEITVDQRTDSTKVTGLNIRHTKSFNNDPYAEDAMRVLYSNDGWKNAFGNDNTLSAPSSLTGSRNTLNGTTDSTKITGLHIKAGPNAGGGGDAKSWCFGIRVDDNAGRQKTTGMETNLNAKDSVTGSNIILSGGSDSTIINGQKILYGGKGKEFFGNIILPYSPTDSFPYTTITGSFMKLGSRNSVTGSNMILKGGSDSAVVIGHRIDYSGIGKSFFGEIIGDGCDQDCDNWYNAAIGNDMKLSATTSLIGTQQTLHSLSDSGVVIGQKTLIKGKGKSFTGLYIGPNDPDDDFGGSFYKNIGSDMKLAAANSVIGSRYSLNGKTDATKIIGSAYYLNLNDSAKGSSIGSYYEMKSKATSWLMDGTVIASDTAGGMLFNFSGRESTSRLFSYKIALNSPAKSAKGISIDANGTSWTNGSRIDGFEVNFNGTNADTANGVHVKLNNTKSNIGGEYDVSGGTHNTGMHIITSGPGEGGLFNVSNGASAIIAMGGNVGIGTTTPSSLFSVGQTNGFQIDYNGNVKSINSVAYNFPFSQGSAGQTLQNDGTGNLSWLGLSGDVTGGLNNATVVKLQNIPVTSVAPTFGQILKFNGSSWNCAEDSINAAPTGPAGGDLSGNYPNPLVSKIKNVAVSATLPTNGQVLKYNSTTLQYEPATVIPQVSFEAGVQPVTPIPINVPTVIIYGAPTFNDGGSYNQVTGIFTAPATGKYHFDASVQWLVVAAGPIYSVSLSVNGVVKKNTNNTSNFVQDIMQLLSIDLSLAAGDQVKITVQHNSTATKNISGGTTACTFSGHQLY